MPFCAVEESRELMYASFSQCKTRYSHFPVRIAVRQNFPASYSWSTSWHTPSVKKSTKSKTYTSKTFLDMGKLIRFSIFHIFQTVPAEIRTSFWTLPLQAWVFYLLEGVMDFPIAQIWIVPTQLIFRMTSMKWLLNMGAIWGNTMVLLNQILWYSVTGIVEQNIGGSFFDFQVIGLIPEPIRSI